MELAHVGRRLRTDDGIYQGLALHETDIPANWDSKGHVQLSVRTPRGQQVAPVGGPAAAAEVAASQAGRGQGGLQHALDEQPASELLDQFRSFMRLACWLALLFAGYGLQRGLCVGGLPYDCSPVNASDVYSALTSLAFSGGALGWLAGALRPARFAWLFAPRRCYLWLAYAATLPIYSAVANIPALQASLANAGSWGAAMIVVMVAAGLAALAAAAFHIHLARRAGSSISISSGGGGGITSSGGAGNFHMYSSGVFDAGMPAAAAAAVDSPSWPGGGGGGGGKNVSSRGSSSSCDSGDRRRALGLYLLPRLAVLLYFAAWLAALPSSGAFTLHLHHYALGWGVAIFAAFNHPVSGLVLALATAVYVQGAGAYGFDPFFNRVPAPTNATGGGCLPVSSGTTGQMTCAFWGADPFALKFCSDTPWIPWFDCTVAWPWPETAIRSSNASVAAALLHGGSGMGGSGSLIHAAAAAAPAALLLAPLGEPML